MLLVLAPLSDFFFMSEEFKSNLPVCASFDDETLSKIGKGVSDLETCMDYFSLPGRSCENLKI